MKDEKTAGVGGPSSSPLTRPCDEGSRVDSSQPSGSGSPLAEALRLFFDEQERTREWLKLPEPEAVLNGE